MVLGWYRQSRATRSASRVNSGVFGGSVVCAPYKKNYERVIKHDHGGFQAAISIVAIDLSDYQRIRERSRRKLKSPPAGFTRH